MIRSGDTSAEAQARQLEAWRRMTPGERLAVAAEMSDALRGLVEAGIRSRRPDATASEVQAAVAEALLGPELAAALRRQLAERIDFIIRRNRPFSVEEFERRRPADLLGTPGYIATVEDMVVAKLEWAAATDSERQLRDVAGMLAIGGDDIDRDYVVRWVDALGLGGVWQRVSD